MKNFLLCMSCFLLLTFAACAGSTDNGIEPEAEKEIKTENIDVADDTGDTADVVGDGENTTDIIGDATDITGDTADKSMPDVSDDQDKTFTFDIADYYTEGQEQNTSPDAYRTIYAQIIKKLPEDISFGFICLDDDDIPELVIRPEITAYYIYTARDGILSCLVDSVHTKEMCYYERSGIISTFWTARGGGDSGGYGRLYYQVSEDQTITDDSDPILTRSYEAIYDENNNFTGEGEVTCSYMGQDIDEKAYDEVCRDLGIDGERRGLGGSIHKEAAVLMLSRPDPADPVSSGKAHDAYREVYKKKMEDSADDTEFHFIYLDDDDILELAACEDESIHSIYTFKDGVLSCIVDSMKAEYVYYYKGQGVICLSDGWVWQSEGERSRYYQTSAGETLTDDSQPVLERNSKEIYGGEGQEFDEKEVLSHYRYMGEDTDRETYEKICGELGITEDKEKGYRPDKEIVLELLNP